jgi:AcrR family transcriptional regulator
MARQPRRPIDLKESCVQAAREVIAEQGVESLSMRDVARRLGISHQAPYRHFESRDHLLAEIMRRCFADFANHLDARLPGTDDRTDLAAMGEAYLDYAIAKPLEYRLMFGTPWPEPAQHSGLVADAVHAFDILRNNLRRRHGTAAGMQARADLDALFIWSALHGMASISQSQAMDNLRLAPGVATAFRGYLMQKVGIALEVPVHPRPADCRPAPGSAGTGISRASTRKPSPPRSISGSRAR